MSDDKKFVLVTEGKYKGLVCEMLAMGNGPVSVALPECVQHLEPNGIFHLTVDDCHPVKLVDSTTVFHVVDFKSPMYPEDNEIIGVFSSDAEAEKAIEKVVKDNNPKHYQGNASNYNTVERHLDQRY